MKKMATIVLGLALVLTLVGCGNNAQSSDAHNAESVSYTHLDVYKRQRYILPRCVQLGTPLIFLSLIFLYLL